MGPCHFAVSSEIEKKEVLTVLNELDGLERPGNHNYTYHV